MSLVVAITGATGHSHGHGDHTAPITSGSFHMLALARMGAVIAPPVPAFYPRPATVDHVVDDVCTRVLDQFGLSVPGATRWTGTRGVVRAIGDRRS